MKHGTEDAGMFVQGETWGRDRTGTINSQVGHINQPRWRQQIMGGTKQAGAAFMQTPASLPQG